MPVNIHGVRLYTMAEVAQVADVTRQTVWRWKRDGKIPPGRRYRGRELLFTQEEMEEVYAYAHRLEFEGSDSDFQDQLKLFSE